MLKADEVKPFSLDWVTAKIVGRVPFLSIYLCGIKFFYETTLKRTWRVFGLVRPKHIKKLPVVLSGSAMASIRLIGVVVKRPCSRLGLVGNEGGKMMCMLNSCTP